MDKNDIRNIVLCPMGTRIRDFTKIRKSGVFYNRNACKSRARKRAKEEGASAIRFLWRSSVSPRHIAIRACSPDKYVLGRTKS
jgi:hypothetical protein